MNSSHSRATTTTAATDVYPGYRRAERNGACRRGRRRKNFAKARDLGAWLGLVPRQHTTGGKPRLLGITKRGNTYLRTLLIHGARAALPSLSQSDTPLGHWLKAD